MSVLIRGMEMPIDCPYCPLAHWNFKSEFMGCEIAKKHFSTEELYADGRPEFCPLVPVPKHGRQDGLYSKYFVIKTETGEIVQDCFVLRPQKDKAAVAALLLYAEETESKELSSDIRGWISTIIPAEEGE